LRFGNLGKTHLNFRDATLKPSITQGFKANPGLEFANAFGVYSLGWNLPTPFGVIALRSLADVGFALPEEAYLIHIYTTSPRRL